MPPVWLVCVGRLATNIKYMQEQVRKAQRMRERKSEGEASGGDGGDADGGGGGGDADGGEKTGGESGEKAGAGTCGDADGVTSLRPISERGESKLSDGFGMSAEDLLAPGKVAKVAPDGKLAKAGTGGGAPAAAALPPRAVGDGGGTAGDGGDDGGGGTCISHLQSRVKLQTSPCDDLDDVTKRERPTATAAAATTATAAAAAATTAVEEEAFEEMPTGVGPSLWGRARKRIAPKTEAVAQGRGSTESIPEILKVVNLAREMQQKNARQAAGAAAVGAAAALPGLHQAKHEVGAVSPLVAVPGARGGSPVLVEGAPPAAVASGSASGGVGGGGGGDPLLFSGVQRLVGDVAELRAQQRADTARLEQRLTAVQTQLEQAVKLMGELRADTRQPAKLGSTGAADG